MRIVQIASIVMIITGCFRTAWCGPAFVQYMDSVDPSASNVIYAPSSSNVTTGNFMVCWLMWYPAVAGIASLTDTSGNQYIQAVAPQAAGGANCNVINGSLQALYYASNIQGGAVGTFKIILTMTQSVGAGDVFYSCHEYSGISKFNPLDQATGQTGSSTTPNSGSVTTTAPNELIFGGIFVDGSVSSGAGFNARSSLYANVSEDKFVSSIGSYSATGSGANQCWVAQIATFKAAALPAAILGSPSP